MPKNKSKDAAAENASADSLSFAGLLCVEDDKQCKPQNIHASIPPPPTNNSTKNRKEDIDFEFNSAIHKSNADNSLADVLFSNGQLLPQAIQLHTTTSHQSQVPSSRCNNKRANESAKKTNKANKQRGTVSQWFGRKIIRSLFATPCRNCRAIQSSPSMKEQALRQ